MNRLLAKEIFWVLWLAALVFVFPIPGTIALRNLVLLIGVAVLLGTGRGNVPTRISNLQPAAWCLLALTLWIALHSALIAKDAGGALDQLRANWLNQILIAAIAAWAASQVRPCAAARAIVVALAGHVLWQLGHQAVLAWSTGAWPFKITPFASYDYHGMLNSFLFALLMADRLAVLLGRESPLGFVGRTGWGLLAVSIAADIALQSRNSTLVDLMILVVAAMTLIVIRRRAPRAGTAALLVLVLIGTASFSFDPRWKGLRESVSIGWTSHNMYWLTADAAHLPATPSGADLDQSAYFRVAWARQAVDLIGEHPLGIGFGHDSFGRAIAARYGQKGWGSSHSGWLDFALGVGLPGLALLVLAAAFAIRGGWHHFQQTGNGAGLILAFFVGGYWFRVLLDGHLTGWRLGLFAVISGTLIALMRQDKRSA